LLLLLLLPGLASAQVYKCKDPKTGRVTYVQTKPKDGDCSGNVPTAPAPASDGSDPLKGFSEEVGKSRAAEAQARDQADKARAQKESLCAQWRQRLTALEAASRVFTVDEQGERHYRSDAENEQQKAEARQGVAANCG
jgi:hypothetical protein